VAANDVLSEAARMVTKLTRPRPIIRAAAVDAVRRGLRMALSRPSRPGTPRKRAAGAPMIRASGAATSGDSIATPP
jgi:hypothetical protein